MRSNLWRGAKAACAAIVLLITFATVQAEAKDLPPIKTLGVVSDMGDKVRLQHIGFMVFSNKLVVAEFPEWQIDAHINGVIETALKDRYEFRAVDFPKGQIAPELGGIQLSGPSPEKNMRAHAKPANGEAIDAYLVVWPHRREVYPTNQQVESIGLLTQGKTARLYIAFVVTLLDARTFEEIDACGAMANKRDFWNPDRSYMNVAPDLYTESFEALTPEQKQALEQRLKQMVSDGLTHCLRDLKLMP
jgi:hypothetical protein